MEESGLETELPVKLEVPYTHLHLLERKCLVVFPGPEHQTESPYNGSYFDSQFQVIQSLKAGKASRLLLLVVEDQEADSSELKPELNMSNKLPSKTLQSLGLLATYHRQQIRDFKLSQNSTTC